jgi:hypothetical protein
LDLWVEEKRLKLGFLGQVFDCFLKCGIESVLCQIEAGVLCDVLLCGFLGGVF